MGSTVVVTMAATNAATTANLAAMNAANVAAMNAGTAARLSQQTETQYARQSASHNDVPDAGTVVAVAMILAVVFFLLCLKGYFNRRE